MSDKPTSEVAVREPTRLDEIARLGSWLALSESGDQSEKARGAAAALRIYYAAELGLPPLAVAELSVIKGRLFVGAQLLRALAERAGYRVIRIDDDDTKATAVLIHRETGEELGRATYTVEDAKRAGLIRDKGGWTTHPGRMCWARASKNVIVDYAPGVALGLALDDEATEYADTVTEEWVPLDAADEYDAQTEPVEPA